VRLRLSLQICSSHAALAACEPTPISDTGTFRAAGSESITMSLEKIGDDNQSIRAVMRLGLRGSGEDLSTLCRLMTQPNLSNDLQGLLFHLVYPCSLGLYRVEPQRAKVWHRWLRELSFAPLFVPKRQNPVALRDHVSAGGHWGQQDAGRLSILGGWPHSLDDDVRLDQSLTDPEESPLVRLAIAQIALSDGSADACIVRDGDRWYLSGVKRRPLFNGPTPDYEYPGVNLGLQEQRGIVMSKGRFLYGALAFALETKMVRIGSEDAGAFYALYQRWFVNRQCWHDERASARLWKALKVADLMGPEAIEAWRAVLPYSMTAAKRLGENGAIVSASELGWHQDSYIRGVMSRVPLGTPKADRRRFDASPYVLERAALHEAHRHDDRFCNKENVAPQVVASYHDAVLYIQAAVA
jgi:hypothetical protein